ncbi:MAG: type II secretion system protein [Phycisphaeraceae bacterium]
MNLTFHRSTARGFSLIELLTVVLIIALLAGILLPTLNYARERAQSAAKMAQLRAIGTAADSYHMSFNAYPGYYADGDLLQSGDAADVNANQNLVLSLMGGVDPDGTINPDSFGTGPRTMAGQRYDAFYSPSPEELMMDANSWELGPGGLDPDVPMIVDPVSGAPIFYSRVNPQGNEPVTEWPTGGGQVAYGPYAGGAFPQRHSGAPTLLNANTMAMVLVNEKMSPFTDEGQDLADWNLPENVITGGYVLMAPNRNGVFLEQSSPDVTLEGKEDLTEFRDVFVVGGSR